ncbi:hypothetical protein ACQY0O_007299 [Thecaphora frezii]
MVPLASHKPYDHITILGAGVAGLTAAVALLETPQPRARLVTIVSQHIPRLPPRRRHAGGADLPLATSSLSDAGTASATLPATYASAWAGGHHVSDAKTPRDKRHDQQTFERLCQLLEQRPWAHGEYELEAEPLVWVHQTEYFEVLNHDGSHPATGVLDWYPDFRILPRSALPPGIVAGCSFSTLDIHVPVYLGWLLSRFLELGGRVVQQSVSALAQVATLAERANSGSSASFGPVDLVVVSAGLGGRSIQGVEDAEMQPQRGQVVLVRAPWLRATSHPSAAVGVGPRHELPGYSIVRPQGGRETYVIPRGDGTVVCGGTRILDDWDGAVRPETTHAILSRCLKLCPDLARRDRAFGHLVAPRVEDVEVVGAHVGLRPARRGGVRLERGADVDGVKVVHSYGYGGAGYQASWGAAYEGKQVSGSTAQGKRQRPAPPRWPGDAEFHCISDGMNLDLEPYFLPLLGRIPVACTMCLWHVRGMNVVV